MKKREAGYNMRMTVREKLQLMKQIEERNEQRRKEFATANKTANNSTSVRITKEEQQKQNE